MQSILSGGGISKALDRIGRAMPPSVINSCKLWPAVTAFSFAYVNPQYRALFAGGLGILISSLYAANRVPGGVAIGWQCYLSWLNQVSAEDPHAMALIDAPQEGAVTSP